NRPMDAKTFLLGFTFATQGALPESGSANAPGFGYQTCPHVAFSFSATNYIPHTAAGGYLFGSVGGSAASQFWDNFPFAELYGANAGSYTDDAPMDAPVISHLGSVATHDEHTLAVVGLQPLLSVSIGGSGGGLYTLAHQNRVMRFGTGGDAKTILDALYAPGLWNGGVIGHTGAPRKHQRGSFQ
ncbi:MAG TPA: hypothetical protein PK890_06090, partial [Terrimesophilobacter sp.]|nr:hypothetical protein [Terrimesophilobacter sp.]